MIQSFADAYIEITTINKKITNYIQLIEL